MQLHFTVCIRYSGRERTWRACARYSLTTDWVLQCVCLCLSVFGVVSVVFLCSHPVTGVARIFFIGGCVTSPISEKTAILCCFIIIMRPVLGGALSVAPQSVCPSVIWRYRHQTGSTISGSQWMRSQQQHPSVRWLYCNATPYWPGRRRESNRSYVA